MADLLRPEDLKKISEDIDMERAKKAFEKIQAKEREARDLEDSFMHRDLHPDVKLRVNNAVKRAAEQGLNQIQVLTFPASYCNDRGRRINNLEHDWPESLEGFAKRAYQFYLSELQPLGFKLTAQILDYPEGMPGTVGVFLSWDR
ncbi:hypothetical protein [Dongia sp.]|uniref:hypothetical protein n=1 Tax=Dongia sp. TaxID=1977262 RepID=UPI0035AFFB4F